ncbi:MAG TPA: hypothetical protein VHQ65_12070 [Thermoanaerobaculia bacterium]|nr:hypothetical protein [Thermoanaerobaculia bacterium]
MAKQSKQQKTTKGQSQAAKPEIPSKARPGTRAGSVADAAAEREMDRLRAAREEFVARLGERMTAVRDGKLEPELPEAARQAQIDRVRQRIARREAARDEVVARLGQEIRRDEELIAELERQARPQGGARGGTKAGGGAKKGG